MQMADTGTLSVTVMDASVCASIKKENLPADGNADVVFPQHLRKLFKNSAENSNICS